MSPFDSKTETFENVSGIGSGLLFRNLIQTIMRFKEVLELPKLIGNAFDSNGMVYFRRADLIEKLAVCRYIP